MRTHIEPSQSWPRVLLPFICLSAHIPLVFSIPQSLSARQNVFDSLKLPPCAQTCFVDEVLEDGCTNETDFACHCGKGDIIRKSSKCFKQKCRLEEVDDATKKLQVACGGLGMQQSSATTSTAATLSSNPSRTSMSGVAMSGNGQPAASSSSNGYSPPVSSSPPSSTANSWPSASSMSTDWPLAPQPQHLEISAGAKAGIAVSISFVSIALFLILAWYIRRLKRDLKTAQAHNDLDATIPEMSAATNLPSRWPSNRRHSPLSPLSPVTVSDNGYGVLKKKRGTVLSLVVEQKDEPEDQTSLIREPVPGQREGLSVPVELDAERRSLVEAPVSITPRDRSRER
jgi:hypothetical protein